MKTNFISLSTIFVAIFIATVLAISGCASTTPLKNQPQHIMQNFKYYERKIVYASNPPWTNTGITVQEGDIIILLASGSVNISSRLFDEPPSNRLYYSIGENSYPMLAYYTGYVEMGTSMFLCSTLGCPDRQAV